MSSSVLVKTRKEVREKCLRCGFEMAELRVCHLKCFNCGAEEDCSD